MNPEKYSKAALENVDLQMKNAEKFARLKPGEGGAKEYMIENAKRDSKILKERRDALVDSAHHEALQEDIERTLDHTPDVPDMGYRATTYNDVIFTSYAGTEKFRLKRSGDGLTYEVYSIEKTGERALGTVPTMDLEHMPFQGRRPFTIPGVIDLQKGIGRIETGN
jgi:hypothetical protein